MNDCKFALGIDLCLLFTGIFYLMGYFMLERNV